MGSAPASNLSQHEQDQQFSDVVQREQSRLKRFILRRVPDRRDAEDILQDVFHELLRAYRMLQPAEHLSAWMFRVARNRITDLFRRPRPDTLDEPAFMEEDTAVTLADLLPSAEAGPAAQYARRLLLDELREALEELPAGQREAFVAHELKGRSFKEMAQATGLSINTLLSRKHTAVKQLRERLRAVYDEFLQDEERP